MTFAEFVSNIIDKWGQDDVICTADFSEAFDSVNHDIVSKSKLYSYRFFFESNQLF